MLLSGPILAWALQTFADSPEMEARIRADVVPGNFYIAVYFKSQNLEIAAEWLTTSKSDFLFWGGEFRQ